MVLVFHPKIQNKTLIISDLSKNQTLLKYYPQFYDARQQLSANFTSFISYNRIDKPFILDVMKKVFFTSLLFLMAFAGFSQKALIKKEKGVFTQTENSSKTKFQLVATPQEMASINEHVTHYSDRLVFKSKSLDNNTYDCELEVTNNNAPEYVHKMFTLFGIQSIVFDGKSKTLNELPALLKSLL